MTVAHSPSPATSRQPPGFSRLSALLVLQGFGSTDQLTRMIRRGLCVVPNGKSIR